VSASESPLPTSRILSRSGSRQACSQAAGSGAPVPGLRHSVRNAFRKQAGWAKLQKVRATAATHWTACVWYRHNQRWLRASKEGAEASKSGSFKDEREWGKKCFEDLDQRRIGRPATSTWSTDFLLREGSSREEIGKWLKNKSIPWQRQRRLLQVVTGTFPCGQQLVRDDVVYWYLIQ